MVQPTRGISLDSDPGPLIERFGGAHPIESIPDELEIVQQGRRASHYELRPRVETPVDVLHGLLDQVRFGEPAQ